MDYSKVVLFFIALHLLFTGVTAQQSDFDYTQHGRNWPASCTGPSLHNQSPIILPRQINSDKQSYLFADFRQTPAKGVFFNFTIYINTESPQTIWFGQIYTKIIKQQHFAFKAFEIRIRSHSEHRIADKEGFKDLQIQISFKPLLGKKNDRVMMGLLFEAKDDYSDDPFLAQVIKKMKVNQTFELNVNLDHLLSRQEIFNFWFYLGSITTPPCKDKGMNWIIPDKIFKMSSNQKEVIRSLFGENGNWRDVQTDQGNEIGYARVLPENDQL